MLAGILRRGRQKDWPPSYRSREAAKINTAHIIIRPFIIHRSTRYPSTFKRQTIHFIFAYLAPRASLVLHLSINQKRAVRNAALVIFTASSLRRLPRPLANCNIRRCHQIDRAKPQGPQAAKLPFSSFVCLAARPPFHNLQPRRVRETRRRTFHLV